MISATGFSYISHCSDIYMGQLGQVAYDTNLGWVVGPTKHINLYWVRFVDPSKHINVYKNGFNPNVQS